MTISNIESDSLQKYKSASSALAKRLTAMDKSNGVAATRSVQVVDNTTGVQSNVDVQETQTASFAQMLSKILAANDTKQMDNTEKAGADSEVFSMQSLQGSRSVLQRVTGEWGDGKNLLDNTSVFR